MPFVDLLVVVIALLAAHRHIEMRDALLLHAQALQKRQAHLRQLGLAVFLVRQQHQIRLPNSLLGLPRDVIGVASPDANEKQLQHQFASVPEGNLGSSPRGR